MLVNVRDQLINFYFQVVDGVAVDLSKFIGIVEDGFEFVGVVGSVHDNKNVGFVSEADYYIMMVFDGFSGIIRSIVSIELFEKSRRLVASARS